VNEHDAFTPLVSMQDGSVAAPSVDVKVTVLLKFVLILLFASRAVTLMLLATPTPTAEGTDAKRKLLSAPGDRLKPELVASDSPLEDAVSV
jgi:hypothetical protein